MEGFNTPEHFDIDLFNQEGNHIKEQNKQFKTAEGEGSFKKFMFKNIHVCYGDIRLNEHSYVAITFPVPVVEMYFSILGNSSVSIESGTQYTFQGNEHNLIFCPDKQYLVGSPDSKKLSYTFHIVFTEHYFLSLVHRAYPVLDSFSSEMLRRKFVMLAKSNMLITPEMNSILQEMMNCSRSGMLKCLFMEAKVIKLLMLQIEQYEQLQIQNSSWLKSHDIEKIHSVKAIIDNNISKSHSLMELAREAGINDFKLKKGFKEVYGTTVFGYLKDIRMIEAKKMLLKNDIPIADIAMLCGYKFVQNFTNAFKKEFGITPDKFRS
ncbi:helix-turn-helix transcriptional regulator [Flavobacterium hauense]